MTIRLTYGADGSTPAFTFPMISTKVLDRGDTPGRRPEWEWNSLAGLGCSLYSG